MFARLRPLIAALCTATLLAPLPALAAAKGDTFPRAVLWKIEKSGVQKPSWLFGTAHVSDPKVTKLSPQVQKAFDDADTVTTEVRIDFNGMMDFAKRVLMPEGELLANQIDSKHYQKLLPELAARDYPEVAAKRMRPWAAAMLLMVPKKKAGDLPLDLMLAKMAIEGGKEYTGLETISEQASVFETIPADKQKTLLYALIDQQPDLDAYYKKLIAMYVQRDVEGIVRFADKDEVTLPAADQAYFNDWKQKTLIDDRNDRMNERMQAQLAKGGSFIAVGALHLPGKTGLVAQLKKQGYTLTPIDDRKRK
ncbi:TraB/GumN family protein [Jeongeupia naejangsanensis]|uniref:TraB/GumN family protein n=1 Tax=Jeongeupia naejangsanensis TaxID=613195 RepID=A0ABS2BMS5_9NEIS|nr:TraB/GumN family protein [Jeongeupia naejangsanensis]MBM3116919.1 TraB/GumN family protein [Jeongeupia naejangsanensis]